MVDEPAWDGEIRILELGYNIVRVVITWFSIEIGRVAFESNCLSGFRLLVSRNYAPSTEKSRLSQEFLLPECLT